MKLTPELRKPLPPPPSEVSGNKHLPTVTVEVQAFNSRMKDYYNVHSQQNSPNYKDSCETSGQMGGVCSVNNTPVKEGGRRLQGGSSSGGDSGQTTIPASKSGSKNNDGIGSSAVSNPRFTYSCFLCGRNFGSRSLGIHLPQCLNRWELTEALLPLEEQRERPQMPKELMDPGRPSRLRAFKDGAAEGVLPSCPKEVDAFNRAMSELARRNWQNDLSPEKPGRSAGKHCSPSLSSSVGSHSVVTPGEHTPEVNSGKKDSALTRLAKLAFGGNMPSFVKRSVEGESGGGETTAKAYVCYLCGQQFGARSLGIHLHHCYREREAQNLRLPHPRPPLPLPPRELADPNNPVRLHANQDGVLMEGVLPTNDAHIKEFNTAMTEYWRARLPKCLHCKSVFLPEQLPEHQPSCSIAHKKPLQQASGFSKHASYVPSSIQQSGGIGSHNPSPIKQPSAATHQHHQHHQSNVPPPQHQQHHQQRPAPSQHQSKASRLAHAQAVLKLGGYRHYRCYLCEEKFPGRHLKVHCMECKRAWVKAEEVLPESMRRLLPPPPPEMRLILTGQAELPVDPSDVAAFNAAMAAHWESTSLLRCSQCKGCFRPATYMAAHGREKCALLSNASDDTTVSLGDVSSSLLTPPITRAIGRPSYVPELALAYLGSSSTRSQQANTKAATAAKLEAGRKQAAVAKKHEYHHQAAPAGKTKATQPTEQKLLQQKLLSLEQKQKATSKQEHHAASSPAVKSTLMAAASALKSNGKASKTPSKRPPTSQNSTPAKAPAAVKASRMSSATTTAKQAAAPSASAPRTATLPKRAAAKTPVSKPKAVSKTKSSGWTTWSLDKTAGTTVKESVGPPSAGVNKPAPVSEAPSHAVASKAAAAGTTVSGVKKASSGTANINKTSEAVVADSIRTAGASPLVSGNKSPLLATLSSSGTLSSPSKSVESHMLLHNGSAPGMYACYCCGSHFHYASFHMHVGQCIRKWERSQLAVEDKAERMAPPPTPNAVKAHHLPTDPAGIAAFNEEMRAHREKYAMRQCRTCNKQISALLLVRHQKHCEANSGLTGSSAWVKPQASVAKPAKRTSASAATRVKLAYRCYVCSDSFNAMKYHSHVDACRKRFEKQENERRQKMPEGFKKPVKLPNPGSDHKRLPVQPEHVAAFNDKMNELHETVLMSIKLSMPPKDMTTSCHEGGNLDHGSPMSTAGRGHLASPSPHTLSMMTTKLQAALINSGGTGKDEAFDFFTPLPTGCALKKGDVMISCRHCGKAVSEQELITHVPTCKQANCTDSNCGQRTTSRPASHRSNRASARPNSYRMGEEPMILVRAHSHRSSRRGTMEDLPGAGAPAPSPIAPSISETEAVVPPSPLLDITTTSKLTTHLRPSNAHTETGKSIKTSASLRTKIKASFSSFGSKLKRKLGGGNSAEKGCPAPTSTAVTVTAV